MRRLFMVATVAVAGLLLCLALSPGCPSAWLRWGLLLEECPAGPPVVVARLSSPGLSRGEPASVRVEADLQLLPRDARWPEQLPTLALDAFTAELALVTDGGEARPLDCAWRAHGPGLRCDLVVPADLPDGDHLLRATVHPRRLPAAVVEAPVALYAPALVHVLTDRPLVQPGDTVRFRALTLGLLDGRPLGGRSGTWTVADPAGRTVLSEPMQADAWGVVDSDLPLAADARPGTWTVTWRTGQDEGQARVEVGRHSLPQLVLEARPTGGAAGGAWFAPGEAITVAGHLRTASGLPVARGEITVQVEADQGWPPPLSWTEARTARTDRDGAFRLVLEPVPADLAGRSVPVATLTAVGPTGERIATRLPLVLSAAPVTVAAVTELGEGLVADLSNRLYLRVATPDGRALAGRTVHVQNPWDPRDTGRSAVADEDGVVALNLDPGQPVRLLVPAAVRRTPAGPPPRGAALTLARLLTLSGEQGALTANLSARIEALDRTCGWRVRSRGARRYGLVVRGGRAELPAPLRDDLDRCVGQGLVGTPGGDGVYELSVSASPDRGAVRLSAELQRAGIVEPPGVEALLLAAVQQAEGCVQEAEAAPDSPLVLHWQTTAGSPVVRTRVVEQAGWPALSCLAAALSAPSLDDPATEAVEAAAADVHGVLRLSMTVPAPPTSPVPAGPTTTTGYELAVTVDGVGATTWRTTASVPPRLRLRPSKVLLEPGEAFTVQALRGPTHKGELPAYLRVQAGRSPELRCPRTPALLGEQELPEDCPPPDDSDLFHLQAPEGSGGFVRISVEDVSVQVYVRPPAGHRLALESDAATYAPGRTATVTVQTGQPAIVSLVGVDSQLGQLAALPGADDLSRAVVPVRGEGEVLGAFDAFALASGRIRGEAAALATIQRLSLSPLGPLDRAPTPVQATGTGVGRAELLAAFVPLLAEVRRSLAATEGPLDHATYAAAWDAAARAHPDPFGRPLRLSLLPDELLALAEPRHVVADAARLPEDVEPWLPWVRRSLP